jgi:insulysin
VYRDVEHIEPITKQDMIDFFNTHIDPASKTRAKISTHLLAQAKSDDAESTKSSTKKTEEPEAVKDETASATSSELRVEEQKKEVGTAIRIEDVRSFKASMPLSEAMRPVKDLAEFEDKGAKL